jgi:hypothetical protein
VTRGNRGKALDDRIAGKIQIATDAGGRKLRYTSR